MFQPSAPTRLERSHPRTKPFNSAYQIVGPQRVRVQVAPILKNVRFLDLEPASNGIEFDAAPGGG